MKPQDPLHEQRYADPQYTAGKKPYGQPQLQVYGSVSSLTQAGATGGNEGGTMGGMMAVSMSDQRTKTGVVRIDLHPLGVELYLFDFKPEYREAWGHGRQFGVIAQEVEQVMPAAVTNHPSGYKMVDYSMLGIDRSSR